MDGSPPTKQIAAKSWVQECAAPRHLLQIMWIARPNQADCKHATHRVGDGRLVAHGLQERVEPPHAWQIMWMTRPSQASRKQILHRVGRRRLVRFALDK